MFLTDYFRQRAARRDRTAMLRLGVPLCREQDRFHLGRKLRQETGLGATHMYRTLDALACAGWVEERLAFDPIRIRDVTVRAFRVTPYGLRRFANLARHSAGDIDIYSGDNAPRQVATPDDTLLFERPPIW